MRKFLMLLLGLLAVCSQIWAQRTVTGKVTDEKGAPVPNASVVVKGTNQGTVTNNEGVYSINVPANGKTLVISSVDFGTREVAIGAQSSVDVTLQAADKSLQEVVVVGYGTQRRKEITGSVTRVSGKQIENLPIVSPDQALQGRASGVTVTQSSGTPGSSINVNIRGVGSLSGSSQPLYVIDGIPVSTGSYSQIGVGGQTMNSLADLNPNDIESFEVLKDASATAVYGARAANGVVLITTKRGRNQKTKINYGASFGFQNKWRQIETLTGPEQIALIQEQVKARFGNFAPSALGLVGYDGTPSSYPTTKWQDEVFREAPIMQHDLSAVGGNDKTRFFVGGSYFDQEGIVLGSDFKRYTLRANLDNTINEKLKFSSGLSLSRSLSNRIQNDNNIFGVLSTAVLSSPHIPVYNADGSYARDPNNSIENPIASAKEIYNLVKNNRVLANLSGEYQIVPALTFKANVGVDYVVLNELNHFPTTTQSGAGVGGSASEGYNQSLNLINENILTFKKRFNDHDITAIGVASFQEIKFESLFGTAQQFPTNAVRRLSAGAIKSTVTSDESGQGIIGYVARVNYGFKDRYLASASIRRDGASNFGENTRWGTFPAVSAAWRISEESFMQGVRAINDLKIRGSYGIVGNAGLGLFPGRALVGVGANYLQQGGLAPTQLGNPNLSWEESEQTDIAIEVGAFNRINLTVEAYQRNTKELLQFQPLVGSSGFTGINSNVGELENRGLEFTLNTQNVRGKDFKWNTDFNITFQENKIKKLVGGTPFASGFASWVQEGEALGSFRGYRVIGIFQNTAEIAAAPIQVVNANPLAATAPGDLRFADLDGDGRITGSDQEILGSAVPKFFGGMSNNFSYKGFELNAFLQFVSGNEIYNNTRAFAEGMNSIFGQFATVRDRWTTTKTNTSMPRAVFNDPNNNRRVSDRFLEDGSYMRLKNVVLSYTLPSSILSRAKVNSVKVFVQGQNLATWTDYSGFDPEVSTFSITNTAPGTDFLTFPQARTITFGLNVGF